jgi:multidrug efflux pump subunit AcrA (membrane-fusion protein)
MASIRLQLLFGVSLALTSICSSSAPKSEEVKPKAIVQVMSLMDDSQRLLFPAKVEAKVNSTVTADLDGHVKKVLKTLGSKVSAGEVVLYLENRDPAFTFSAVPVRSPVAGVISQMDFQLMSRISKGEKLFTVINADLLKVSVEVPASEIHRLRPGTLGTFRLNINAENPLPVRVVGLSPVIDPRTGTASAEIEFVSNIAASGSTGSSASSKVVLPPVGTVGQVSFLISSGKVILLPENSLSYVEGKPTVKVVDAQNKAHRRAIELGVQREDQYVVKAGLQPGDRVVIRASKSIKEDEEIEIQSADKPNDNSSTN